ncbi:hypothetical protein like AT3G09510 [Hibiscus trionum]|uniref:RNase H type-1 domain-containing protein n=1 Tax=Hibiscus trionum TaxID=183268 RepID=A0A9W7I0N5_HIBTR|nr:hypothetical protein like AT3G09510 [Hibiscus trionum]
MASVVSDLERLAIRSEEDESLEIESSDPDFSVSAPSRRRSQPESIWLREADPIDSMPRLSPDQSKQGKSALSDVTNLPNLGISSNRGKIKRIDSGLNVQSTPIASLSKVSDFMDDSGSSWNISLVNEVFNPEEAEEVLSIPISSYRTQDRLIWTGEHSGVYSVRSGYRLLLPSNTIPNLELETFKLIWQVNCPSKMNVQCWKFLRNFVPTKCNLCVRRVISDPTCARCLQEPEDVAHVLRNCSYADQVWSNLGIQCPKIAQNVSFSSWLLDLFKHVGSNKSTEIIVALWAIWTARNKFIFEGATTRPIDTATSIKGYAMDIRLVSNRIGFNNPSACARWTAPTAPCVKVNVDASFNKNTKSATLGVAIRNVEGYFLGASSTVTYRVSSPFAAEAQTVIQGLRLALDLGFEQLEVEGDSRSIISKLASGSLDSSEVAALISEANGLSLNFRRCDFSFVHRSGNSVAHALSKFRQSVEVDHFWVDEVPPRIEAAAAGDRRWLDPP